MLSIAEVAHLESLDYHSLFDLLEIQMKIRLSLPDFPLAFSLKRCNCQLLSSSRSLLITFTLLAVLSLLFGRRFQLKRGHPGVPLTLRNYVGLRLLPGLPGGCFGLQCQQIVKVLALALSLVGVLPRIIKNLCGDVLVLVVVSVSKVDCLGQVVLL